MPNDKQNFHQALHGYRDGHRLLASSCSLSKESERTMLALSDLSGHSIKKGFEEYITGYPLKGDNLFVLAKTWYAAEMPRPGCVWTHSILIDFSLLATIDDLQSLYSLFTKPSAQEDFSSYKKGFCSYGVNYAYATIDVRVAHILRGLYETPDSPVVIITSSATSYQPAITALWSQQWPKLRRNFTFCTGAIAPRRLDKELLDIQVLHPSSLAEVKSRNKNAVIINDAEVIYNAHAPSAPWLELAQSDLCSEKKKTKFRKFLYEFGGEFENERAAFTKLANSYSALENAKNTGFTSAYEEIAKIFPKANEARALKKALIEQKERATEWLGESWNIASIANFILFSEESSAFQANDNLLESVIEQAWHTDPSSFVNSIKKLDINSAVWKTSIKKLTPIIEAPDLPFCKEMGETFFKEVLSRKPELLLSTKSWEYEKDFPELYSHLTAEFVQSHPKQITSVLNNALEVKANCSLKIIYSNHPVKFVTIFLEQLEKNPTKTLLAKSNIQFLAKDLHLTLEIVKKTKITSLETLSLVYERIPAYDMQLLGLYPEIWLPIVDEAKSSRLLKSSSVPLMLIGLMNASNTGLKLVEATFNKVHKKIVEISLNQEEMNLLKQYIEPPGHSFFFWFTEKAKAESLAESLRRILVSRFVENDWDKKILKKIITEKSTKTFFEKTLFFEQNQSKLVSKALK